MGSMQRNKGKRGELMHRDVLRSLGFSGAERGQQRHGGPDSPDVRNGIPDAHPEVKYYKSHAAIRHLEQAIDEKPDGAVPYVVLRENGMKLMDEVWMIRASDIEAFIENFRKGDK